MLKKLLQEKILILDGAMGTNVQKYGLEENDYRSEIFKNHEVELKGKSKILSDDAKIEWSSDSNQITLTTNNNSANIIAPAKGSGTTVSYITISHPKADTNKKVLVMTADDKETLNTMKVLYSDKNSYSIENGTSTSCYISAVGFDENYDFSNIKC